MTYLAQEQSQSAGEVVELYEFTTAAGRTLLTSADQPVFYNAERYEPEVLGRSQVIQESLETNGQTLALRLRRDHPLAIRYIVTVPALLDNVRIFRGQVNDTGVTVDTDGTLNLPAAAVITYFRGTVATVAFEGSSAELRVRGRNDVLDRNLPKRTYRNLCNHVLYDAGCQVNPASFQYTVTITAINGKVLTVSGIPDIAGPVDAAFFDGGILLQSLTGDARMIQVLTRTGGGNGTIQVIIPFESVTLGGTLLLRAGCNHSLPTCIAKFANGRRYGGFPTVPTKNPFISRIA